MFIELKNEVGNHIIVNTNHIIQVEKDSTGRAMIWIREFDNCIRTRHKYETLKKDLKALPVAYTADKV